MGNSKSKAGEHQPKEDVTTGLTSGRDVEEANASIIPVAENVDDTCTTVPDGSRLLRVGDHHDASLSALSNLTLDYGTFEAQNEYGAHLISKGNRSAPYSNI